ncbi:MAG: homoaconitase [Phycisphaerae bacterium]
MPQTLIEKIAQRYAVGLAGGHEVRAGDFLSIRPAHVMTHDNTSAVIPKFKSMGATRVADPDQPVFALDHDIQNTAADNVAKYDKIRAFAKEQGIAFHPAGRGIGHQIMLEEGFVLPGSFVVGSDSHSNIYGALGALGTPVVRTDAAAIWATGRTWWQVPEVVKVTLQGALAPGVTGKDVIIALIGTFVNDEVLNCCLEFTGPGVAALGVEERMTIANMTTEWGALAGVFPYDKVTREYLLARAEHFKERGDARPRLTPELVAKLDAEALAADARAAYAKELTFDLSAVTPFVAGPNEVKTIAPVGELEARDIRIDKAFLMSCVNGRLQDFAAAAEVMEGRRVAKHVKLYIAAASNEIEEEAKRLGYWGKLVAAGAIVLPAGCGACIGLGDGVLADGEVGISATNRNFKGRMGSRESFVYLASPAVVAASAAAGRIAGPRADARPAQELREAVRRSAECHVNRLERPAARVEIIDGFPKAIEGELLFVPKDNMNTDGIYGKEYTYQEGLTPEQMAKVAMANYDPAFQELAEDGDVLVGGYNFGSGSSREQAATALKYRGLQLIIAGSFSQTYKRNAFNNGYICLECPQLVDELRVEYREDKRLTIRTDRPTVVDFIESKITCDGVGYPFAALGEVAQQLIAQGGFEPVIRQQLAELGKK